MVFSLSVNQSWIGISSKSQAFQSDQVQKCQISVVEVWYCCTLIVSQAWEFFRKFLISGKKDFALRALESHKYDFNGSRVLKNSKVFVALLLVPPNHPADLLLRYAHWLQPLALLCGAAHGYVQEIFAMSTVMPG